MLVLSRKKGESIIVQDNIEFVILEVNADTVRIGINAPKDIEILRKEIYSTVRESNKEAAVQTTGLEGLHNILKKNDQR